MTSSTDNKREDFLAYKQLGKPFSLKIAGHSMKPLLDDMCSVIVEPESIDIKWGEIVVFYYNDTLTVHRVVRIKNSEGVLLLQTKGDNSLNLDPQRIKKDDVIGRVIGVMRNNELVSLESRRWQIYACLLALYSYGVGMMIMTCKTLMKPLGRDSTSKFTIIGGKILLICVSLIPRSISIVFRLKPHKKR